MMLGNSLFAQYKVTIGGKITRKGEPISGATVHVYGTTNGCFTQDDGTFLFTFEHPDTSITLRISYGKIIKNAMVDLTEEGMDFNKAIHLDFTSKKKYSFSQYDLK